MKKIKVKIGRLVFVSEQKKTLKVGSTYRDLFPRLKRSEMLVNFDTNKELKLTDPIKDGVQIVVIPRVKPKVNRSLFAKQVKYLPTD